MGKIISNQEGRALLANTALARELDQLAGDSKTETFVHVCFALSYCCTNFTAARFYSVITTFSPRRKDTSSCAVTASGRPVRVHVFYVMRTVPLPVELLICFWAFGDLPLPHDQARPTKKSRLN